MKKIQIDIKNDGTIDIEAFGYNGVGCTEATKVFEEALGGDIERTRKPEYYTRETNKETITNRNNN
jgi:hypothetical protein